MSGAADTLAVPLPMATRANTPDALLFALLEQQQWIDRQAVIDARKTRTIDNLNARVQVLEEQLRLERHRRFGSSIEANALQTALDLNDDTPALADGDADPDAGDTDTPDEPTRSAPRPRGKKGLSPDVARVRREFRLSDAERESALETFFIKVKEELDIVPAQVKAIEYWQEKAVYRDVDGERTVRAAARPPALDRQGHRLG